MIWRTANGQWNVTESEYKGREFVPVAYEMARVRSDAAGRLQATFKTPEDFGFNHDIVLQQGDRLMTQVDYSIDMSVEVSPRSGPLGTPITIDVKGIGYRNLEMSFNLLYDNRWTGWISAVTTHGSGRLTIPATGHVGDHVIEVLHGQFGFPYRNQEQSPEPDRPRFSIPFTVTAGAPVLPPPPAAQAQTHVRLQAPHGELRSNPRFSGVGEKVTVTGEKFTPGQRYTLNWTRVIGNRIDGGGWETSSVPVGEAVADREGRVAITLRDARRSRRHARPVHRRGRHAADWHPLREDDCAPDGSDARAGRHEDHAAPEGCRLDRDVEHHASRLRQRATSATRARSTARVT